VRMMKKTIRLLLSIIVLVASFSLYTIANAENSAKEKKQLRELGNRSNVVYDMTQNTDILGALPPIVIIDEKGNIAKGTFAYPNYDNARLGEWELEWVFTPDDPDYEMVLGKIKLNVIPPEPEIEEPTTPSLTASTVLLETRTGYDINLNNKISGSKYRWISSNPDIVEVNAKNGKIKAIKPGKATITCEITLPDDTVQVLKSEVVVGYDENAPLLTETVLDLEVGDKFDINLENKIAKSAYRWVSSDRNVVKVNSANGKVTAVGAGEAYVTCTITTPDNQVIVLRCDINVTEPVKTIE
jgi:hypothetical protein